MQLLVMYALVLMRISSYEQETAALNKLTYILLIGVTKMENCIQELEIWHQLYDQPRIVALAFLW